MEGIMDRRRFVAAGALLVGLVPQQANAQSEYQELCQYRGSIFMTLNMLGWMFEEVSQLTETSTGADYIDEQFRVDLLAPYGVAKAAQETIALINPPIAFREFHDLLVEAIENLVISGDYMEEGVLTLDESSMELAVEHLQTATDLMDQAYNALPEGGLPGVAQNPN
jgi:hypothetical protein